jgi:hypothetical protein
MALNIRHQVVTLSDTTPTLCVLHPTDSAPNGVAVSVQNIDGEATVYIGDINVTALDYGFAIASGESFSLASIPKQIKLYAISDVNGSKVAMMKVIN